MIKMGNFLKIVACFSYGGKPLFFVSTNKSDFFLFAKLKTYEEKLTGLTKIYILSLRIYKLSLSIYILRLSFYILKLSIENLTRNLRFLFASFTTITVRI